MLNVTAQRSAKDAEQYFAKADYYAQGDEIVGNWGGKGAVLLGLFGEVDREAFGQLCHNLNPKTGKSLTRITRDDRRVGYDFTWSAPKSTSAVHALTGDERIVQAFRDSVHETMQDMEAEVKTRVRKDGADEDRTTGNLVWAEFLHKTSRPVQGLPCPQLHIHAFALNCTYDVVESKWKAGEFRPLKESAFYWQAVQQARFAEKLQGLGYAIRKTKDAFEIDGVPETVLKKFSLRTMQIERAAERLGITDPKAKAKLGATTREAKLDGIPYPQLIAKWETMVTPEERAAVRGCAGASGPVADRSAEHAKFTVDHSFERATVVDERRLLTLALRHGIGSATPEGVQKAMKGLGLLRREDQGKTYATTKLALRQERQVLDFAVRGKGSCKPMAAALPPGWEAQLPTDRFSEEQRRAAKYLLESKDRLVIVRGRAGTGKTRMTSVAVERMEQAGRNVVMLAPSANASRNVLRSEGFAEADTIARFLQDEKMQAGAKNGVIWVDEAGLIGTRDFLALCETAKSLDARLVIAGDRRQLSSVAYGTPLTLLEDVAKLKIAELTENFRQEARDYKQAVTLLAAGKAREAVDALDRLGWVKTLPVWDRYKPVAKEFVDKLIETRGDPNGVLIVCPTHSEGSKVVDAAREEMRARGLIHGEERTFRQLVPLQWTEAQLGDREQYRGDEVLQLHRRTGAFAAGERLTAGAMLASARPPSPKCFAAFRDDTIVLAAGDVVRVTATGRTQNGRHKINNGSVYGVSSFTPAGDIVLSNSWVIDKDFAHLSHGMVSTAHASQGRTVRHVLVVQGEESSPAATKEGLYVALSRGRQSAAVFVDSVHDLRAAAERSERRVSATELAKKPRAKWWNRMRDRMVRRQLDALIAHAAETQPQHTREAYAHAR